MAGYYHHLAAGDYIPAFPVSVDPLPALIQRRTFIDAWMFNLLFSRILAVQQYIIDNRTNIEA
jgi:hypothetical protein